MGAFWGVFFLFFFCVPTSAICQFACDAPSTMLQFLFGFALLFVLWLLLVILDGVECDVYVCFLLLLLFAIRSSIQKRLLGYCTFMFLFFGLVFFLLFMVWFSLLRLPLLPLSRSVCNHNNNKGLNNGTDNRGNLRLFCWKDYFEFYLFIKNVTIYFYVQFKNFTNIISLGLQSVIKKSLSIPVVLLI